MKPSRTLSSLNTDLECDLATSLTSSKDLLNNTMPIKVTSEVSPTSCTRIDKIYQCPICRKSFGIPLEFNLLELHMKDKHEAELDLKSLEADSVCRKWKLNLTNGICDSMSGSFFIWKIFIDEDIILGNVAMSGSIYSVKPKRFQMIIIFF